MSNYWPQDLKLFYPFGGHRLVLKLENSSLLNDFADLCHGEINTEEALYDSCFDFAFHEIRGAHKIYQNITYFYWVNFYVNKLTSILEGIDILVREDFARKFSSTTPFVRFCLRKGKGVEKFNLKPSVQKSLKKFLHFVGETGKKSQPIGGKRTRTTLAFGKTPEEIKKAKVLRKVENWLEHA